MPRHHFARDLRVSRFICADQAKGRELPQKEKCRDRNEQNPVGNSRAIVQSLWVLSVGLCVLCGYVFSNTKSTEEIIFSF